MRLQFAFFAIAMLILLAGSPLSAQTSAPIVGMPSAGVVPAMVTAPVQPIPLPVVTVPVVPFSAPSAPLTPPVAASIIQPMVIEGKPNFAVTNSIRIEPVIVSPLGSIQIEILPGFFPGSFPASFNTTSSPVVFQTPIR